MRKIIEIKGFILAFVITLLFAVPVFGDTNENSADLLSVNIGLTTVSSKQYTAFNTVSTNAIMKKQDFYHVEADLIDAENNIFYADVSDVTGDYLVIAGERASDNAGITIEDMADLGNVSSKDYSIDYELGYTKGGTYTPQNPFITRGYGDVGAQNTSKSLYYLRTHIGASCFRITVTNGSNKKIYYLVINNGGKTRTVNTNLTYSVDEIQLYDGISKCRLADDMQLMSESPYVGKLDNISFPENISSVRISVKRSEATVSDSTIAYYESCSMDDIYRTDDNYVSINGKDWIQIEGDGETLSQELVLKQGLNIIQVRGRTDAEMDFAVGPVYGTSVMFIYCENNVDYEAVKSDNTEIKSVRVFRTTTASKKNSYKEYEIEEVEGEKIINISSAETSVLLAIATEDPEAKVEILNATENIGGRYLTPISQEDYNIAVPISIYVTPANGDEEKYQTYELYVDWISGQATLESIEITGADLSPAFSRDNKIYELENVENEITFTYSLSENAYINSISVDGEALENVSDNTFRTTSENKEIIINISAEADGLTQNSSYYLEMPYKAGKVDTETYNSARTMLDKAWEGYEAECGIYAHDGSYWGTFIAEADNRLVEDSLIYDIETHKFNQATDYAAVILELIMAGENPYNYNGKDYVAGLMNEKTSSGAFGPYANNIWALMALDAAGYDYDGKDVLINVVANQAVSATFDLDMRGWALLASKAHIDDPVIKAKVTYAIRNIENERLLRNSKFSGILKHVEYKAPNALTQGCVISGLIANDIDISADEWSPLNLEGQKQNPVTVLEYFQTESGMFYWKTEDDWETFIFPSYGKDVMIALGDVCAGSNVWQRAVLTNDDYIDILEQATNVLSSLSVEDKDKLQSAINIFKNNQNGRTYYNLRETLYSVKPSLKKRLFMCTEEEKETVLVVDKLINNINTEDYMQCVETIQKAGEAYDALGGDDTELKEKLQGYVKNSESLTKALADEDVIAVIKVTDAIEAVTAGSTPELAECEAVRNEYDKLTETQKKGVYNYSALTDLIAELEEAAANEAKVQNVIDLIAALPEVDAVTLDDEAQVNAAQEAYDALDGTLQESVTNYNELTAVQNQLNELRAVAPVIAKINEIGEVTLENLKEKEVIAIEARNLYNALTDERKKLVSNYDALVDAENFIATNKVPEDIADLITKIDVLRVTADGSDGPLKLTEQNDGVPTEEIWADWKAYVADVRSQVNRIEEGRQGAITNLASLEMAEAYLKELKFTALNTQLEMLPDSGEIADGRQLTEEELSRIVEAAATYDNLTQEEKTEFDSRYPEAAANLQTLKEIAVDYDGYREQQIKKAAGDIAKEYEKVMESEITRDNVGSVQNILDSYDDRYADMKEELEITKVTVGDEELTIAEIMANLQAQVEQVERDVAAAKAVDEWIQSLPTDITADNISNVEAEIAAIDAEVKNLTPKAESYLYFKNQLEVVKQLVSDYRKEELRNEIESFRGTKVTGLQAVSAGPKAIQLKWNALKDAEGYYVYRAAAENGTYKQIAAVTGTSYKNKKLTCGKKYFYKVCAYRTIDGSKVISTSSAVKKCKPVPAKATLKKVKAKKNAATLKWKKVKQASGYVVYRAAKKNGKYKAVKTIKKRKIVTYTDKKLKSKKTYYYKVRAYRKVNGKKVFGKYSAVKKVKVK